MVSKAFQDLLHSLLFLHPQSFHHRRQSGWWSMMSLVFLCLLLLITFLSFMCLELESRRMYSMNFPDTEVELTISSPDCPLAIVKFNLMLIFFQLSETFLSHQDFSSRIDSNLVIMSAPSTPSGASHKLLPNILLPCCWLPLPLQFIPVCTEDSGGLCLWRMRQQMCWVLQHFPCHEVWEPQQLFIWCGVATQHTYQSLCGSQSL